MNFRDPIKRICKEKGITQKKLANMLGLTSDISLNQTLRGEYPQLQTLERIAIALNVPISELFEQPQQQSLICPKCGTKLILQEQ